jgi:hypothetical protein
MLVTADPVVLIFVVPVIDAPPTVTVRPPVVATSPVEAVNEPVTAVLPVALPILTAPVPPVPIVVTADPEALMLAVPTCVKAARVDKPSAVKVVPAVRDVVVVRLPGVTTALTRPIVAVEPDPVVVSSLEAPEMLMFPAAGVTTVESCVVRVFKAPEALPIRDQVGTTFPDTEEKDVSTYSVLATSFIHLFPMG